VVAEIDPVTCIGCQLCVVACDDGAHQCIHQPGVAAIPDHVAPMAAEAAERAREAPLEEPYRVPWVDETECVGCNLCALVCPVHGCIEMAERRRAPDVDTWNDRVRDGRDVVPGGLRDLRDGRASPTARH
jgi:dihydropyrimidine dehydrogenase (NAD+) subunit PreA